MGIVACLATGGSGIPVPDPDDAEVLLQPREEDFYTKSQSELDPVQGSLSDKGEDDDTDLTLSLPQEEVEKSDQVEDGVEAATAPKLRVKREFFLNRL